MNNEKITQLVLDLGVKLADLGFTRPTELRDRFDEVVKHLESSTSS